MPTADTLLRRAHEGAYRFPPGFAGFTAAVQVGRAQAQVVVRGRNAIELIAEPFDTALDDPDFAIVPSATGVSEPTSPDRELAVRVAADLDWARPELSSMIGHRWPTGYDEGDGRWTKKVNGELVQLLDDPFKSTYRVSEETIREVHRTVGAVRFVISVAERAIAHDGRYLPSQFAVFHWSTDTGRLLRADQYQDSYTRVGDVHLPAGRRVTTATDDGLTVREFRLTGHALVEAAEGATKGATDA